MAKTSVDDIIEAYVEHKVGKEVTTSDIEGELRIFAELYYNAIHNPSTFSRRWRMFRKVAEEKGFHITETNHPKRKQTTWSISRSQSVPHPAGA